MKTLRTVGEFAVTVPSCIPVFERLKIDFCCRGNETIQRACREAGITPSELLNMIDLEPAPAAFRSWEGSSLSEIIHFVVDTHHLYTRRTLDTLDRMSRKVRDRHGDNHPEVAELALVVGDLIDDLLPHMMKEEQILFPYIEQLEDAMLTGNETPSARFGSARIPVQSTMLEHESVGAKLLEARALTNDYSLPRDACTTFAAYYSLLQELEQDLHNHIHVESNILFPRAVALEEKSPAGVW